MKHDENEPLPQSYMDALETDPLLLACINSGMSCHEIIGELCARHALLEVSIMAAAMARTIVHRVRNQELGTMPDASKAAGCDDGGGR